MQIDAKNIPIKYRNITRNYPKSFMEIKTNRNKPATKRTPNGQY